MDIKHLNNIFIYPLLAGKLAAKLPRLWFGRVIPLYCQWDVTYRCNLNCRHCYLGLTGEQAINELDTPSALNLIGQLKRAGTLIIYFCGGEPTLRSDLGLLLREVRKAGMLSIVATNGQLLEKALPALNEAGWVRVSVNGDQESHDELCRRAGAWDRSIRMVELLRQEGVKVGINCVVWPGLSRKSIAGLLATVRPLGVKVDLSPITTDLKPLEDPKPSDRRSEVEAIKMPIREFIAVVEDLRKEFGKTVVNSVMYKLLARRDGLAGLGCRAVNTTISVRPDGTFSYPCSAFPMVRFEGDLDNVLMGKEVAETRKKQGRYWFCQDCYYRCMTMPSLLVNPLRVLQFFSMYFR